MKKLLIFLLITFISPQLIAEDFNDAPDDLFESSVIPNKVSHQKITPIAENPDVEAQVDGNYPDLKRPDSLPLGAIQHAWDRASTQSGVYQVNFNSREVIKLVTREFMTTSVVLPPWEKIEEIIVGDESSYRVTKPKPNIIMIRPNEFVGIDTSITALGQSGHVYAFYVRSEGYNSKHISDIMVHLRVPAPKYLDKNGKLNGSEIELAQQTDYLDSVIFDPANLDFDFSMAGNKSIAPDHVFSDGVRTWFDYGKKMGKKTLPTIYAVIDGVDTPINVSREGSKLVAQHTGCFCLKSGKKVTCVYPSDKKNSSG